MRVNKLHRNSASTRSRLWSLAAFVSFCCCLEGVCAHSRRNRSRTRPTRGSREVERVSPSPTTGTLHPSNNDADTATKNESPFVILLDGGSTGSRLHIFEFVVTNNNKQAAPTEEIVRRGTARADRPLSAFVGAPPETLADYLMPTFQYAADIVPPEYAATTRVLYQATAGMRLLTTDQQQAIYDALYEGLVQRTDFVFQLERSDIATLTGDLEGYYGALAANYLHGTINTQLELLPNQNKDNSSNNQHNGVVGALDMGGSSTQIVFLPQHHPHYQSVHVPNDDDDDDDTVCLNYDAEHDIEITPECHVARRDEYPRVLQGEDFFAVSYLSYGADQFRERLWTTWITEWQALNGSPKTCDAHVLPNPCAFKGYEAEWQGYKLVGTGEAHKCVQEVQRHIPHPEQTLEELNDETSEQQMVGGIAHPPVHGKFVAMSLYFFTLDTLRALSHPDKEAYEALNLSWPNPSINELYNALDGLCSRQWQGDLEEIKHDAHPFTKAEVLPHRCMEAVYIVILLRDGFGFPPESRDITFTFLVDGSEVEWTLGMALAMRAEERYSLEKLAPANGKAEENRYISAREAARRHSSTNLTHNPPSTTSCTAEDAAVEDFRKEIICHTATSTAS